MPAHMFILLSLAATHFRFSDFDESLKFKGQKGIYCKPGKIHCAKLLRFSWLSGVPWKFFREYKCLSLIVLKLIISTYDQETRKYFCENFDDAGTMNI